jgi:LysM repeat protein
MGAYRPTGLRMLAPISLVAFAVVFLIVIVSSLSGGSESKSKGVSASAQRTGKQTHRARRTGTSNSKGATGATGATGASGATGAFANRRFYVVKAGDTLVVIAERTGVPIEDLLSLNPSIDPQGLVTGQRVKLRE